MNTKNPFSVSNPRILFGGCMTVIGLMILMLVLFTIFTEPPHLAMYICTFLFIILPLSIAAMWSGLYKVTVNGSRITVRRATGIQYRFDVSEVKKVNWRKNIIRLPAYEEPSGVAGVRSEVIRIYTSSGKRISIETLMVGFEEMSEYVLENVDSGKIHYISNRQ